jgi:hypothetical protein
MVQKWEYKSVVVITSLESLTRTDLLDPVLRKWAEDGWELVSTNANDTLETFRLFWRRPVSQRCRPARFARRRMACGSITCQQNDVAPASPWPGPRFALYSFLFLIVITDI